MNQPEIQLNLQYTKKNIKKTHNRENFKTRETNSPEPNIKFHYVDLETQKP